MEKPNIIVILPDQLRRHALSCYGDKNIKTQNIDKLAEKGVKFTKSCSTYPVCVPFRYTLMTGKPAHQRDIPTIHYTISEDETTLADEFNQNGYETVYLGKWHLHNKIEEGQKDWNGFGEIPRVPREHRGRWQHWYGYDSNADHFKTKYYKNDETEPKYIENKLETDSIFGLGMKHIADRKHKNKPFCMVLSVSPPHDHRPSEDFLNKYPVHKRYPNKFSYNPPLDLLKKWDNKDLILPPNFKPEDKEARDYFIQGMKGYYALVENLDNNVGYLQNFLKENQLDNNTIIVLISDHGEMGGCHEPVHKECPYEESIAVPLIVYDPRKPELKGKIIGDPVNTEDLYPTLLGLAGIKTERKDIPGENCAPLVFGDIDKLNRPGVMLELVKENRPFMKWYNKSWRGFVSKRFKYTAIKEGDNPARDWQFFDTLKDPYEIKNLIDESEYSEEIQKHRNYLRDAMKKTNDFFELK